MDPFATHLAPLVGALCRLPERESVLELGCGDYSTPLLAEFCEATNREFRVWASDEKWIAKYRDIADIEIVDWATVEFEGPYGLVLLDNEQMAAERNGHMPALAKAARVVVLHDANIAVRQKNWPEIERLFGGVKMHKRYKPWTAVCYQ